MPAPAPDAPIRHFRVLDRGVGKYAHGDTFAAYELWDPKLDPEWSKQVERLLALGAIEEIDAAAASDPAQVPGSAVTGL